MPRTQRSREIAKAKRIPVTAARLTDAISRVLNYNYSDEEEDFLHADHTASLDEHIFGALVILQQFLGEEEKDHA